MSEEIEDELEFRIVDLSNENAVSEIND